MTRAGFFVGERVRPILTSVCNAPGFVIFLYMAAAFLITLLFIRRLSLYIPIRNVNCGLVVMV